MDTRHEEKQRARFALNVTQALEIAGVSSPSGYFGNNPFLAMGASVALAGLVHHLEPDWARQADWAEHLFPRMEKNIFGWIVARDMGAILSMARAEKLKDDCRKSLEMASAWGLQVANGEASSKSMRQVSVEIGKGLLAPLLRQSAPGPQSFMDCVDRLEQVFEFCVTQGGKAGGFDDALAGHHSMAIASLIELATISFSTQLHRLGLMEFEAIGNWSKICNRFSPTRKSTFFLQKWLQAPREEVPIIGPVAALHALNTAWGQPPGDAFLRLVTGTIQMSKNFYAESAEQAA